MAARLLELPGQAERQASGALVMINPRPGTFKINIQLLSGRAISLWVWEHTTIKALARDMALLEKLYVDDIRFGNEVYWMDRYTGSMPSRLQWLWEPIVPGGYRGDWDLKLANLNNGGKIYVDFPDGDEDYEAMSRQE
ncbi:hypothetical protein Slin15195_G114330 [Septoria linicola]|uniref:Uncharacterized protein n=1 Tax=Septoria linicola TaxID=215465 RepID=A0A9Q9AZ90_9PEZI|nr:hypothetical protein Slin14017_G112650 [Septoria linicola]USW58114.1 hypothetical protein Slin15195_G114330 [Septoria linicola]